VIGGVPFARRVCAVSLLLLLSFLAALPAAARQYRIKDFNEQVTINSNGTVEVTEIMEFSFTGSYQGIFRTIPVEYTTPQGLNFSLLLEPISVTDEDGHSLKYEQTREGRYIKFKIFVPNAQDATRTVMLRYRLLDAVWFYEDHDELYWNVTGDQWPVPIESASAHIELPFGTTGLHAVAYTGVFGSRAQDARIQIDANTVEIQTTRSLSFHEGLTAVIGWDKGFVHPPGAAARVMLFLRSNWPLFIPIAAFFVMFWLWWTRGRDPERDAITVQYEPPDKLTPGECGTLVDNEAAMRDITATLVDLAVKGYIVIEQKDQDGLLGFTHHRDYVFHMKKHPAQWNDVRPHERAMLGGLFFSGDSVLDQSFGASPGIVPPSPGVQQYSITAGTVPAQSAPVSTNAPPIIEDYSAAFRGSGSIGENSQPSIALSALQNHFYTQLPAIRDCIFDALMADGYYLHRPDTVRQGYIGGGILIGAMIAVLGRMLGAATGVAHFTWVLAGILTGAVICGFGWFMPARTLTGARTLAKVLGFENFLGRVESDRIERLEKTPELFEKFLPYAMALHVEKKWVQAFSDIAMQPPQWYQGGYGSGFVPFVLVNDLNMMSTQVGSTMMSSPRSSGGLGGSGFGGGGGAGGGFGGGGGGAF
jgi:uncharacterized membrane protein YgcG